MTEARIGFLHKIISNLPQTENNESLKRLRSFYLMRCQDITLQYRLPIKFFSSISRCSHCCLEWNKKTDVNIKSIKLSSRQRQRMRARKGSASNENEENLQKALESNQMEQTCSFCNQTTVTTVPKPIKEYPKKFKANYPNSKSACKQKTVEHLKEKTTAAKNTTKNNPIKNKKEKKNNAVSKNMANVYSNAYDVFSLKNKQNTLASTVKEAPKIIKNNKKKKDKFAGLCQKAVLASAKVTKNKGQGSMQNKLNLFLKPSSG